MIRGTTPDYLLTIAGYDLTDKTVYVTIKQDSAVITKTGEQLDVTADSEGTTIAVTLTQRDTLQLHEGKAEVQVRFIDSDGVALATNRADLTVDKVLLERVIAYAGN